MISATLYSDPACPWAYSESPALRVTEAYESDEGETRTAEGSAAELQGKTATTDGPVRFTAPSIVFRSNGTELVAGGFQLVETYDDASDRRAAEAALIELVAQDRATRVALGDDALWLAA